MLKKRENGIYYADISIAGKPRVIKSTFTANKKQAQEYHDRLKDELWRSATLGDKPKFTWTDGIALWLNIKAGKRTIEDDKDKFRWLDNFLRGRKLTDIDAALLNRIREAKLADGVIEATANRYLTLIRSVLNLCKANDMIDTIPSFKGRMVTENSVRETYLTKEQAQTLHDALPDRLKAPFRFALLTGLRKSNVFGLRWNEVDIDRACAWVRATDAKGQKAIPIPLNSSALELVKQMKAIHTHSQYVFGGVKPLEMKGWRRVLRDCLVGEQVENEFGVNLRWHDLRHTWATWHVMAGTPLAELQKLGGWKSYQMVLKYAHFAPAHLAKYAGNVGF